MFLYFFPLLGLDPLNHSRGDKIMKSHLCSRLFLVQLYHLHFSLKSLKQGYLCHLVDHLFCKDLSESGGVSRNALGLSFDETYLMISIAMMSAYPDDNKSVLDKEVEEQGDEAEMTFYSIS